MPKKKEKADALDILQRRYFEGRPERLAELEEARASAEVARQIHQLRTQAGLTQRKLADLVGKSHSVISRLEDDDYQGALPGHAPPHRCGAAPHECRDHIATLRQ